MPDWNASQYLRFEDERTRAARDLLAQVPLTGVRTAIDLGCGPGNSTELLLERYPAARVIGLDSSPDMLHQSRSRLPRCSFIEADLADWQPEEPADLVFANAVFQWVPDHQSVMARIVKALPEGGVFAAQLPDNTAEPSHVLMREVAGTLKGMSGANQGNGTAARDSLPAPESYYDLLKPICRRLEIWHTIYNHVMEGPEAIVEWFRGSALRPFLAGLDTQATGEFLSAYTSEISRHYKARFDGRVLLRFPRLFIVALK